MTKRPNFLFIMTDQQRADWMSCAGHPVLKTPNIDAIAATGTRFENFHATSPICMPNRASFMTGRYPTTHGLRSNGCSLSLRANTFVDVLAAATIWIEIPWVNSSRDRYGLLRYLDYTIDECDSLLLDRDRPLQDAAS